MGGTEVGYLTASQIFRVKRNFGDHPVWLLHFADGETRLPEVKDSPNGSSRLLLKQDPSLLPPGPVPFKRRGRQSLLYSLGYGSNITGALQVAFLLGAPIRFPSGHFPVIPNTWLVH